MTGLSVETSSKPTIAYASAEQQKQVRQAARALGRHQLAHAYGHCSLRLDEDHFLVCAAKPLSTIGPDDEGEVINLHAPLPAHILGEVRAHREIYKANPEINGIVRCMPLALMSLSVMGRTPRTIHGMSSYFHQGVPLWDNPQLIRDDQRAQQLAQQLGHSQAIVMRGNGVVVAGESLMQAVVLTWYLENTAKIEIDCLNSNIAPIELSISEAQQRATTQGRIFERMWDYLTFGDPESITPP